MLGGYSSLAEPLNASVAVMHLAQPREYRNFPVSAEHVFSNQHRDDGLVHRDRPL